MTHAIDMQRLYDALEGAAVWMGAYLMHLEEKMRRYPPVPHIGLSAAIRQREIDDLRLDIAQTKALREQVRSMKESA